MPYFKNWEDKLIVKYNLGDIIYIIFKIWCRYVQNHEKLWKETKKKKKEWENGCNAINILGSELDHKLK